ASCWVSAVCAPADTVDDANKAATTVTANAVCFIEASRIQEVVAETVFYSEANQRGSWTIGKLLFCRIYSDRQCLLWVKSRHMRCKMACPLYPQWRHQMRHMECPLWAQRWTFARPRLALSLG